MTRNRLRYSYCAAAAARAIAPVDRDVAIIWMERAVIHAEKNGVATRRDRGALRRWRASLRGMVRERNRLLRAEQAAREDEARRNRAIAAAHAKAVIAATALNPEA